MTRTHLLRGLCSGVLLAAVQLAGAGVAHAQEKKNAVGAPAAAEGAQSIPESESHSQTSGWTVNCADAGKGLNCNAQQTIVVGRTRQLLLRISISRAADGKAMAVLFQLPHGLFNPAGVVTALDADEPETLEIQTCDAGGCYAGSSMPSDKFAAFTKGTRLSVTFQDLKKQKITVPVQLKGLDEAVKKL